MEHISAVDLETALRRAIQIRTGGRIRDLSVHIGNGCIRIDGCTGTYYSRQLALAAAREVLGPDDAVRMQLDIRVVSDSTRPSEGHAF